MAELQLTSGLVALVFSTITFLNIFNSAIFLKAKIRIYVLVSSIIGFTGVALVFKDEIFNFTFSGENSIAFLMAMIGAVTASLGNITSAYTQKNKMPVIQSNAYGMLYGALSMLLLALLSGIRITFDFSAGYIISLIYLAVFGSVIAFTSFLTLLGKIGADKAGYIALVIPILALTLSTIFEGYRWSVPALAGVVLIILGNIMVLRRKKGNAEA
jgi:drug/metabolite transporter (DMT)-like permease